MTSTLCQSSFSFVAEKELVIIDPLQAFLGPGIDMHRANETRPILSNLSTMAETYQTAVLVIRHLAKATGNKAIYRGMGSIDFTGAARSVLAVGKLPEPSEERVMLHLKSNLAEKGKGQAFMIAEEGLVWTGERDVDADEIMNQIPQKDGALKEVEVFLRAELSEGPKEAKEVQEKAQAHGFTTYQLRKVREKLKVRSYKPSGEEKNACWYWALP
ncbi:AAA family ATPase [Heliorestis convoluta]|uniref:AAA family ATPase n=1 Tax=Heliorestis convoluta TaxID=356322 RepID=A0A5Q2N4M6_9FIRM|nr:AAA family ATPase [Heliorestis convoluta]QGG48883.1 AAA family ATPase [Heliorestis convoluta]